MECDDTNWPLAIMVAERAPTLTDYRAFLDGVQRWLQRGEPFVLLRIFVCPEATALPPGALDETKAWLATNAHRLGTLLLAMATSVPEPGLDAGAGACIEPVFDVPMRTFTRGLFGVTWLSEEILAPVGMSIDSL